MKTQVAIVGAGPAGLCSRSCSQREGIESVVLESRSREYVEQRVRAGVLEQGTVDCPTESGVGERLQREGMVHRGVELRYGGRSHRIALSRADRRARHHASTGSRRSSRTSSRSGWTRAASCASGRGRRAVESFDGDAPVVRFGDGERAALRDVIAGCDGFHGVCRAAVRGRADDLRARVPVRLARDPRRGRAVLGRAHLLPPRPRLRAALACARPRSPACTSRSNPDEDVAAWPDERVWEELQTLALRRRRLRVREGPVVEKGVTPMRSFVAEPLRHGRLFLAGDAAHIVPPTGAKGLNLAVADVRVLARGAGALLRARRRGAASTRTRTAACAACGASSTSRGG